MGLEEVTRIKDFFAANNISVHYLEHEAVITSEDAAKTRGFELRQGIKAILFTNESQWVVACVPAHMRVDAKKVAEITGWSKNKTRIATQEEVRQVTGCEIGAVPPFGHKTRVPIFVDVGVYDNTESTFNIGERTHSVRVRTSDMKQVFELLGAIEGNFAR